MVQEEGLHVLPVEEQEAIGIIKEKRKGTYGLHLLTAVWYAMVKATQWSIIIDVDKALRIQA